MLSKSAVKLTNYELWPSIFILPLPCVSFTACYVATQPVLSAVGWPAVFDATKQEVTLRPCNGTISKLGRTNLPSPRKPHGL